jgi:hypothetical protein
MTIRSIARAAFVLATCVSIAGCDLEAQSAVEGRFERVLSAPERASLDVRTGSGSITVTSGPAGSVSIAARIRGRRSGRNVEERVRQLEAAPPVEQVDGTIRIGRMADRELLRDISISYEIVAPADILLVAQTGSGDQRIEGVRSPVDATSGSGGITLRNVQMGVRAITGSGYIRGEQVGGSFQGRTGSGDLSLAQAADGDVDIETGAGTIDVTGARRALRASTGAGNIRVDGRPAADWDIDSKAGSIHLRVPPDSRFEVDANTAAGSVRVNAPGAIRRTRGTAGGGGPRVEASTLAGSIQID